MGSCDFSLAGDDVFSPFSESLYSEELISVTEESVFDFF